MTEFINSNFYFILSLIIYFILAVYTAVKLSKSFRKFINVNIFSRLSSLPFLIKVKGSFQQNFSFFGKLINSEIKAVIILKKTEIFVSEKLSPVLTEPVNLFSLLLRKLFTDSIPFVITLAAFLIVAFYIILTVL